MQYHTISRTHKNKKTRQVGRGGTRGKTAGRGTKGQNARAGHKKRPEIRDFIKRIPKMRGRGKNINTSIQTKAVAVNLAALAKAFAAGDAVNPETLVAKHLVHMTAGAFPRVKILGTGAIDKKIVVTACEVSASAKAAIEKAGGSVQL